MRRFVRDNGIALLFGGLFLGSVATQAWTGWHVFNHEAQAHDSETIGLGRYLISSHYGQAVLENWQSEFLVIGAVAIFSVFLRARHSVESKWVGAPHAETGSN